MHLERATEFKVREVASRAADANRQEMWAATHQDHVDVVADAFRRSDIACIATAERPVAAAGTVPFSPLSDRAMPWLVVTDEAGEDFGAFLRTSKRVIEAMHARYRILNGMVDADFVKAQFYLRALGFAILAPQPIGPKKRMFYQTWREQ